LQSAVDKKIRVGRLAIQIETPGKKVSVQKDRLGPSAPLNAALARPTAPNRTSQNRLGRRHAGPGRLHDPAELPRRVVGEPPRFRQEL
jgi:hypothetical protein